MIIMMKIGMEKEKKLECYQTRTTVGLRGGYAKSTRRKPYPRATILHDDTNALKLFPSQDIYSKVQIRTPRN